MSVGGDASVGGGGRAANLEVHLDRFCITFCGNAAGWADRSHVVSVLRLEGRRRNTCRRCDEGLPDKGRCRSAPGMGGKEVLDAEGVATG